MIMTNNHVAKYLLKKFPKTTPLRVQPPPKHHREIEWRQRFQFLFDLPIQDEDLEPVKANETDVTEIRFPRRTWHKLIEKVKMRAGFKQIVKVLSDVDHFPHLALAAMRKRKIQQRARYVCSGRILTTFLIHGQQFLQMKEIHPVTLRTQHLRMKTKTEKN